MRGTDSKLVFVEGTAANGNHPDNNGLKWPGGSGTFSVSGTFGSGTFKLQVSFNNGTTWVDVADASFTASGAINVQVSDCLARLNVSGATGASVTGKYVGLPEDRG